MLKVQLAFPNGLILYNESRKHSKLIKRHVYAPVIWISGPLGGLKPRPSKADNSKMNNNWPESFESHGGSTYNLASVGPVNKNKNLNTYSHIHTHIKGPLGRAILFRFSTHALHE